jgi:hypothetical protein
LFLKYALKYSTNTAGLGAAVVGSCQRVDLPEKASLLMVWSCPKNSRPGGWISAPAAGRIGRQFHAAGLNRSVITEIFFMNYPLS